MIAKTKRQVSWILFFIFTSLLIGKADSFMLMNQVVVEYNEGSTPDLKYTNFPATLKLYAGRWSHKTSPKDTYQLSKDGKTLNVKGGCVDEDGKIFSWNMDYKYLDGANAFVKAVYTIEAREVPANHLGSPSFMMRLDKIPKGSVAEIEYADLTKKKILLEKQELEKASFGIVSFTLQINGQFIKIEPGRSNELYVSDSRVGDSSMPNIGVSVTRKNYTEPVHKGDVLNYEMKIKTGFIQSK